MEICVHVGVTFSISPAHLESHSSQPSKFTALYSGADFMILGYIGFTMMVTVFVYAICELLPLPKSPMCQIQFLIESYFPRNKRLQEIVIPKTRIMITTEFQQSRPMPSK